MPDEAGKDPKYGTGGYIAVQDLLKGQPNAVSD
jgi:hypothetical protein